MTDQIRFYLTRSQTKLLQPLLDAASRVCDTGRPGAVFAQVLPSAFDKALIVVQFVDNETSRAINKAVGLDPEKCNPIKRRFG